MGEVLSTAHNQAPPSLILQLNTNEAQDAGAIRGIDALIAKTNSEWRLGQSNCADISKAGLRGADAYADNTLLSTPMQLSQSLWMNNTIQGLLGGSSQLKVFSGDWAGYNSGSGSIWGATLNIISPLWNSLQQNIFTPNASSQSTNDYDWFMP